MNVFDLLNEMTVDKPYDILKGAIIYKTGDMHLFIRRTNVACVFRILNGLTFIDMLHLVSQMLKSPLPFPLKVLPSIHLKCLFW